MVYLFEFFFLPVITVGLAPPPAAVPPATSASAARAVARQPASAPRPTPGKLRGQLRMAPTRGGSDQPDLMKASSNSHEPYRLHSATDVLNDEPSRPQSATHVLNDLAPAFPLVNRNFGHPEALQLHAAKASMPWSTISAGAFLLAVFAVAVARLWRKRANALKSNPQMTEMTKIGTVATAGHSFELPGQPRLAVAASASELRSTDVVEVGEKEHMGLFDPLGCFFQSLGSQTAQIQAEVEHGRLAIWTAFGPQLMKSGIPRGTSAPVLTTRTSEIDCDDTSRAASANMSLLASQTLAKNTSPSQSAISLSSAISQMLPRRPRSTAYRSCFKAASSSPGFGVTAHTCALRMAFGARTSMSLTMCRANSVDLTGKVAFLCGASSSTGYGWAIAKELAEAGATILFGTWPVGLKIFQMEMKKKAMEVPRRLRNGGLLEVAKVYPLDAVYDDPSQVPADVLENKRYKDLPSGFTIQEVVDQVEKDFGKIDILVHALANGPEVAKPLLETSRKGYLMASSASAYSLVSMVSRFGRIMRPGGAVVSLSYIAAQRVIPGYGGGMSSAKAQLESDTRTLAYEAGRRFGIRVNSISAGPLATRAASAIGGGGKPFIARAIEYSEANAPLQTSLVAEHVGKSAFFLLTDMSAAVTGVTLPVDMGMHAMGQSLDSPAWSDAA